MYTIRKVALKVLPLLVVVWATLAVVGGAFHLANKRKLGLSLRSVSSGSSQALVGEPPILQLLQVSRT